MKKIVLITLLFVSTLSYSQNDSCTNIGFEDGNCSGWDLSYGQVDVSATAPFSYINVTATTLAGSSGQHTIMIGAGTDTFGGFPVVFPGGTASLMIGDSTGINNGAADASQIFMVDSINNTFAYHYAFVISDAAFHTPNERPYFTARILDQNGDTIYKNEILGISPTLGGDPDFIAYTNGYYLDWHTQYVNLSAYKGEYVTIEFTTGDCAQGGHYGYAYIDADCLFTTGVNQLSSDNELLVYPNPIRNELKISVPNTLVNYQVEVISITGQPMFKGNNSSKINTTSFAQGIYFVKVWNDKHVIIKKVIKE